MSLGTWRTSVDGTIPVPALLYDDEDLLASQDDVGIYEGLEKAPDFQAGTTYVTSHRLFYVDAAQPDTHSFALDLARIEQTDYYAGLFKSSPKVTLHLAPAQHAQSAPATQAEPSFSDSWECEVCNYSNPPGMSPSTAVCALCGVPRSRGSPAPSRPATAPPAVPNDPPLSASVPSAPSPLARRLSSIACPACTFLNHPSLPECEICATPLPRPERRRPRVVSLAPPPPDVRMVKISFRKGGDKPFYAVLRRSLMGKAWQSKTASKPTTSGSQPAAGIHGVLSNFESSAQHAEDSMQNAFQDLEALMVKAREMVKLASDLNERLTAVASPETAVEPEEATFIRSSLSQLGLQMGNAPVTLDMVKDERRWIEELARELAGVLQGTHDGAEGLMARRGIVGLDEVWGGWNRARGVALLPPATFLAVLPVLPTHTSPPLRTRTFARGLRMLHTPAYTHAAFAARVAALVALAGAQSTAQVAREEGLPIGLAQEMVEAVAADGELCRDEERAMITGGPAAGGGEVRWWLNEWREYVWDGQPDVQVEG